MDWQPGKPWTHPSVQRLSNDELRERYKNARAKRGQDEIEFAGDTRQDVKDLLFHDRDLERTYRVALEEREQPATREP